VITLAQCIAIVVDHWLETGVIREVGDRRRLRKGDQSMRVYGSNPKRYIVISPCALDRQTRDTLHVWLAGHCLARSVVGLEWSGPG
jgi:hypothetical protein